MLLQTQCLIAFAFGFVEIEVQHTLFRSLCYIQWKHITPDFVVDISDFMEKKMEVCKAYKTQLFDANSKDPITYTATKDFMESITYRAQDLGRLSGVDYAEGFVSERLLAFKNFDGIIW